jgi:hypothetical protein
MQSSKLLSKLLKCHLQPSSRQFFFYTESVIERISSPPAFFQSVDTKQGGDGNAGAQERIDGTRGDASEAGAAVSVDEGHNAVRDNLLVLLPVLAVLPA